MIDAALAASSRQRWPASQLGHFDPFLTVYRVLPGETGLLESNRALLEGSPGAAETAPAEPKEPRDRELEIQQERFLRTP
ncbi:hypothetical protein ABZQ70_23925 [Pseudomonas aeruginosa]|uniref:hypothetical protein n=1 Tax=Pseudomonas aeruginosa TaxID=287 RepID=UPI0017B2E802